MQPKGSGSHFCDGFIYFVCVIRQFLDGFIKDYAQGRPGAWNGKPSSDRREGLAQPSLDHAQRTYNPNPNPNLRGDGRFRFDIFLRFHGVLQGSGSVRIFRRFRVLLTTGYYRDGRVRFCSRFSTVSSYLYAEYRVEWVDHFKLFVCAIQGRVGGPGARRGIVSLNETVL